MNTSIVSSIIKIGFFFMLIGGLVNGTMTSPVPNFAPGTLSGQLVMVAAR
jgi:hypothetical protein